MQLLCDTRTCLAERTPNRPRWAQVYFPEPISRMPAVARTRVQKEQHLAWRLCESTHLGLAAVVVFHRLPPTVRHAAAKTCKARRPEPAPCWPRALYNAVYDNMMCWKRIITGLADLSNGLPVHPVVSSPPARCAGNPGRTHPSGNLSHRWSVQPCPGFSQSCETPLAVGDCPGWLCEGQS